MDLLFVRTTVYNTKPKKHLKPSDFQDDFFNQNQKGNYSNENKAIYKNTQSPVPLHFFRLMNMGNMLFNNYLFDSIFRLLRIDKTDILVLPFSGPHSEALNQALKRVSQRSIVVSATGNTS